jgi:[acyl-carrier-protein] S-malonyltransferase
MSQILALFPGQGSQKVGMGKELYAASPTAQRYFNEANEALGFSLSDICFEGPEAKLTETAIAQPAILTVSALCYALARENAPQLPVVAAAGHSLGEYSALVAAKAISFQDAVLLVHKRGTYMQEAVPVGVGKMVAVLGKEMSDINAALEKVTVGVAEVANDNAPGQIVVAGNAEGIKAFVENLPGAKVIELQVSAPFHCSLMKRAQERLALDIAKLSIKAPAFPIYQNVTAQAVIDPEVIRANLISQVCGQVRWVACMQRAIAETSPALTVEFGAGNVLSGLMKRIAPTITRKTVGSVDEAIQCSSLSQAA